MEPEEIFKKLEVETDESEYENNTGVNGLFSERALEDTLDFDANVEELPL